ncbi:MAG: hypothetical protein Q8891_04025 [Bacteroidota bacterium]|nr:hypothetical protein [Bacteroidota bacterium]
MEELIQKLQNTHGLSAEQSQSILNTITSYVKEKFPMVGGAIDNLFQSGSTPAGANNAAQNNGDFLNKISDFIPGATGEKIEEIAKKKLGGFFGENKTD